jgi:hypothetical protein
MSPKSLANQPQNDITLLTKELVTIGAKVPTTPKGGNHGHIATNQNHHHTTTNQNTIKHSGTKGEKLQSSDQQHPKTKGGNHQEPRAKS